MSEAKEQMLLVEKCRQYDWKLRQAGLPESGVGRIFHLPNGGLRTKSEAAKLKAMGVTKGIPDLFVPLMVAGKGGLWIEMKTGDGKLSDEQKTWGRYLESAGYVWAACRGCEAAWRAVCDYVGIREHT